MTRKRRSNCLSLSQLDSERAVSRTLTKPCLPMIPNAKAAEALSEYGPKAALSGVDRRRVENVLMFPFVGDPKAPLTGPRVSEPDRVRARRLCRPELASSKPVIGVLHFDMPVAA